MSRVANTPVELPGGVEVTLAPGASELSVSGAKGQLQLRLTGDVGVAVDDRTLRFEPADPSQRARAMAGTVRSLVNNMVLGVSQGFERQLQLVGVGYRAQAQGRTLNMQLGFSHPILYTVPEGVDVRTPNVHDGCGQRRGQTTCGSGGGRHTRVSTPGALQGQGCQVHERKSSSQGSQEEIARQWF